MTPDSAPKAATKVPDRLQPGYRYPSGATVIDPREKNPLYPNLCRPLRRGEALPNNGRTASDRPYKHSLKEILKQVLKMPILEPELYGISSDTIAVAGRYVDPEIFGITREEAIMFQLVDLACRGNLMAINMIFDRTEGKPVQPTQNTNVNLNYTDFLKAKAAAQRQAGIPDDSAELGIFE